MWVTHEGWGALIDLRLLNTSGPAAGHSAEKSSLFHTVKMQLLGGHVKKTRSRISAQLFKEASRHVVSKPHALPQPTFGRALRGTLSPFSKST